MHLGLNPFRWRRLAIHYASQYAKPLYHLYTLKAKYAELAAQNERLARENARLTLELAGKNNQLAVINQLFPQVNLPSVLWHFRGVNEKHALRLE